MQLPLASLSFVLTVISALGCGRSPQAFPQIVCGTGSIRKWSPDSTMSICLPGSFRLAPEAAAGRARWERSAVQSEDRAWLSISVDTASVPIESWPPQLASSRECAADCLSADSVLHRRDSVAMGIADVETGLVSGGFAGLRSQPMLVAGWRLPSAGRVWVNGFAHHLAALDTLRLAVRTIYVRSAR
jgi:hypothetical protein